MKKHILFSSFGRWADIGGIVIQRMLPNASRKMIGPFFVLDYIAPAKHGIKKAGTGAHPHRGIATLTYILDGEDEHIDSYGNYASVHSGGIQWMKAGKGIIHDERLGPDPLIGNSLIQGFQCWINLPARNKTDPPEYIAIQGKDVPRRDIDLTGSWIKIITGEYQGLRSIIPDYQKQWLYHVHLSPHGHFSLHVPQGEEAAAFIFTSTAEINDAQMGNSQLATFDTMEGTIEIRNNNDDPAALLLFGGTPYTEPVIAEGPFVMNTKYEVRQAYRDFYLNKYGKIDYTIRGITPD